MKEPTLSNKKTQGLFGTYPHFYLPLHRFQNESTSGKVLEWLKRHAWKACNRQNWFAGSNPVLSAPDFQKEDSHGSSFFYNTFPLPHLPQNNPAQTVRKQSAPENILFTSEDAASWNETSFPHDWKIVLPSIWEALRKDV